MKKYKTLKTKVHFTDPVLLSPQNPVSVNLIGCGGTGSKVLEGLARIQNALLAFGHPGLSVRVFDSDKVTAANVGRGFLAAEIGLNKAALLIGQINRDCCTRWKAFDFDYDASTFNRIGKKAAASITLCCVDKVAPRFEITAALSQLAAQLCRDRDQPRYYMDFGNSLSTGQVMLSTLGDHRQPNSKNFETVAHLPLITEEYASLLNDSEQADDSPSCSLAEALTRQDLFINPAIATMGTSLLWKTFRSGMISVRGFFLNLKDFTQHPIPVG